MAVTLASSGKNHVTFHGTTCALPSFTAVTGQTILVWIADDAGNGISSVVDSAGNTYTLEDSQTTGTGGILYLYKKVNATGGAGNVITVTFTGGSDASCTYQAFNGADTTSLDTAAKVKAGGAASSPYSVTTGTLAQADCFIALGIGNGGSGTIVFANTAGGLTKDQDEQDGNTYWVSGVFSGAHTTGTTGVTLTTTMSGSNANDRAIIAVVIKAAGSGTTSLTAAQTAAAPAQTATFAARGALSVAQTALAAAQTATFAVLAALTASQAVPAATQAATFASRGSLSAAQTQPAAAQTATFGAGTSSLTVAQAAAAPSQTATFASLGALSAAQTALAPSQAATLAARGALTVGQTQPAAGQTATLTALAALTASQGQLAASQVATFAARGALTAAQTQPQASQVAQIGATTPSLTVAQSSPAASQVATFSAVGTLTSAQAVPAQSQTATLAARSNLTAAQIMAAPAQAAAFAARATLAAAQFQPAATQAATFTTSFSSTVTPYVPRYGRDDRYFPVDAYRVPVSQKANLQTLLDAHNVIRLDGADYGTGGIANLTIHAGQEVYGVPGRTKLPRVIIDPGCEGATAMGAHSDNGWNFPQSALVTKKNAFGMIGGNLTGLGATLEQNLFASAGTSIRFDNTSLAGRLVGNRFLRMHAHGAGYDGYPAVQLWGDAARTSTDNVFLAFNALGSQKASWDIRRQKRFGGGGWDDESYPADHNDGAAAIVAREIDDFRMIGVGGAVANVDNIDSGADRTTIIYHDANTTGAGKKLKLQSTAAKAAWFHLGDMGGKLTDLATAAFRVYDNANFLVNSNGSTAALTGPQAALGIDLLATPNSTQVAWGFVAERAVPDPAGPNWNVGLAGKPDEVPALQALCNASLIVEVEDRPYYFGTTLKINPGQAFIGGGPNFCFIAKSTSLHMIETQFSSAAIVGDAATAGLTMADIVMYGGRTGYHQTEPNAQLNEFFLTHTTFRYMSEAGIFIDNSYAFDNGWLQMCNFVDCAAGVKQRGTGTGTETTIAYIDKTHFFRCQFIRCGLGIDFQAGRPNNLDPWMECLFKDCTGGAVSLKGAHNYPVFANCQFINCGGTVAADSVLSICIYIKCRFSGSAANSYLVSQQAICEGCIFEKGNGTTSLKIMNLVPEPLTEGFMINAALINCLSVDVPLGPIDQGNSRISLLSVNSKYPPAEARWEKVLSAINYQSQGTWYLGDDVRGAQFSWIDAPVTPGTMFLRDAGVTGATPIAALTASQTAQPAAQTATFVSRPGLVAGQLQPQAAMTAQMRAIGTLSASQVVAPALQTATFQKLAQLTPGPNAMRVPRVEALVVPSAGPPMRR